MFSASFFSLSSRCFDHSSPSRPEKVAVMMFWTSLKVLGNSPNVFLISTSLRPSFFKSRYIESALNASSTSLLDSSNVFLSVSTTTFARMSAAFCSALFFFVTSLNLAAILSITTATFSGDTSPFSSILSMMLEPIFVY